MLPHIIGIGAPKSGTTTFVNALGATRLFDVCRAKDSDTFSANNLERAETLYASEFKDDGRPKIDFSVLYFVSDVAAQNYSELPRKPKLVFLARDPLSQIKSHYWHLRRQNFHTWDTSAPIQTLSELLENSPDAILEPSLYAKHLKKWPWQDPDAFLFLTQEELTREPAKTLDRFAEFCTVELAPEAKAAFLEALNNKQRVGVRPRSSIHEKLYRTLYIGAVSGPYHQLKRLIGPSAADRLKETLRLRQLGQLLFFDSRKNHSDHDQIPQWAVDLIQKDKEELSTAFPKSLSLWNPN